MRLSSVFAMTVMVMMTGYFVQGLDIEDTLGHKIIENGIIDSKFLADSVDVYTIDDDTSIITLLASPANDECLDYEIKPFIVKDGKQIDALGADSCVTPYVEGELDNDPAESSVIDIFFQCNRACATPQLLTMEIVSDAAPAGVDVDSIEGQVVEVSPGVVYHNGSGGVYFTYTIAAHKVCKDGPRKGFFINMADKFQNLVANGVANSNFSVGVAEASRFVVKQEQTDLLLYFDPPSSSMYFEQSGLFDGPISIRGDAAYGGYIQGREVSLIAVYKCKKPGVAHVVLTLPMGSHDNIMVAWSKECGAAKGPRQGFKIESSIENHPNVVEDGVTVADWKGSGILLRYNQNSIQFNALQSGSTKIDTRKPVVTLAPPGIAFVTMSGDLYHHTAPLDDSGDLDIKFSCQARGTVEVLVTLTMEGSDAVEFGFRKECSGTRAKIKIEEEDYPNARAAWMVVFGPACILLAVSVTKFYSGFNREITVARSKKNDDFIAIN